MNPHRHLIASGISALAILCVEELNALVLQWFGLYPSMLLAGRILTLAIAVLAFCPWERSSLRKWTGIVAGLLALVLFDVLDHLLQSGAYPGLDRNALAKGLPLLYGIGFGAPAWTLKGFLATSGLAKAETPLGIDAATGEKFTVPAEGLRTVSAPAEPKFHVVFVHGVHGEHFKTWCKDDDEANYWPKWLAEDFPHAAVYSAQYNAFVTRWKGSTMPLLDRAPSLLNMCQNAELFKRPVVFIVHSYGGLVLKQMWRLANDRSLADVLESLRAAIFVATPHAGSGLQNFLHFTFARLLGRPTPTADELEHAGPLLRDLNIWYRNHPIPKNFVYYETQATEIAPGLELKVVDESSADPGLAAVYPVPMFADHVSICKPAERATSAGIDTSVRRNIADLFPDEAPVATPAPTPVRAEEPDAVRRYLAAQRADMAARVPSAPAIIRLATQRGATEPAPAEFAKDEELLLREFARTLPACRATLDAKQPDVAIESFLADHGRIVLLGAPGSGKSTLLRYLAELFGAPWLGPAEDASQNEIPESLRGRIPLFLSLSRWEDRTVDLHGFVRAELERLGAESLAADLPTLLGGGKVLLLLDGLNEIPQLERDGNDNIIDPRNQSIRAAFESQFANTACVISCRARDFSGGPHWHDLFIRPLDEARVRQLAAAQLHWKPARFSEFSAWIDEAGEARARKLGALTGQPYFALRLLFYFDSGPKLGTPLNHFDLMRFVVRRAIDSVPADLLPQHDKPELMRRLTMLAFNMTDAGYSGTVDKHLAASWLFAVREQANPNQSGAACPVPTPAQQQKAAQILKIAASAGLLSTEGDQVGFDHQVTLEALCATFLRERSLADWLGHACQPQFGEVWQIWSEGDSSLMPKLVTTLQEGATTTTRRHAAYALGQTRSLGAVRALVPALNADPDVAVEAAHALGRIGSEEAIRALVAKLKQGDPEVGLAASHALAWIGKPAVRSILSVLETIQTKSGVIDAVRALGEIGDDRALEPLLQLTRKYNAAKASEVVKECGRADSRIRAELKKRFPLQS